MERNSLHTIRNFQNKPCKCLYAKKKAPNNPHKPHRYQQPLQQPRPRPSQDSTPPPSQSRHKPDYPNATGTRKQDHSEPNYYDSNNSAQQPPPTGFSATTPPTPQPSANQAPSNA